VFQQEEDRRLQRKKAARTNNEGGSEEDKEQNSDKIDQETFAERFGPLLFQTFLATLLAITMCVLGVLAAID
jgi:hypothetical protein